MSTREDIENDRLAYSCNCGWLDLGHLNPASTRNYIGAINLWQQIKNESNIQYPACQFYPAHHGSVIPNRPCVFNDTMHMGKKTGPIGYKVTYLQDMRKWGIQVANQRSYLVRKGLSDMQKKSVALAIFLEVSHLFESLQDSFPFNWITDSGYSQEDLVSNLIGFYIAIGEIDSIAQAKALCHVLTKQQSLSLWDKHGPVGEHKNYTHQPQFLPDTTYDNSMQSSDFCLNQPKKFPEIFYRIKPANKGEYHRDLSFIEG